MSGFDSSQQDTIHIRANAKNNSLTTLAIACFGIFLSALAFKLLPEAFKLFAILLLSGSLVTSLLAWFKFREPAHSLLLTREQIIYQHRLGQWQADWHNIQRIDIPHINGRPLAMVAIKLKDYQPLLNSISPRLSTHLLMEQRPLLIQAQPNCSSGQCYSPELENDQHTLPDGRKIKGVKAMYANRLVTLNQALGYDLFIAAAELDRSEQDFLSLLKQCHQHALSV